MINLSKHNGLTLLEVMVALAIFALTGAAVMKSATDHLSSVGQIEEITVATWVANNRLVQIQAKPVWPPKNNQKGKQEMADRTWYWQQRVKETNDKNFRAVEVIVSLDEQFQSHVTSVTSYLAKPEESS
ncbi:type II secretion system minor pseudopilin GspI [Aestuariibacter sp. AA17]|uniref:Type II secretion system protein I n=1 Tax=Fluctibacter corallii TaxID=2984329 RepID=A0ABT3AAW3_9ALTE|nr:type II secretion system minor pseudopilin GspI [Aestuariibacter sp. AA17]MCV2885805.1 type II secretion system minor pseudopilin GspI [Aestuariibacter sp. AA17]